MIKLPRDLTERLEQLPEAKRSQLIIDAISKELDAITPEITTDEKIYDLVIRTDGASRGNPGLAGAGFIALSEGQIILDGSLFLGNMTNNQAEYRALIFALEKCSDLNLQSIALELDSELAVKQIKGEYKVKNADIMPLHARVKELLANKDWQIKHIPRNLNKEADLLANKAIDNR